MTIIDNFDVTMNRASSQGDNLGAVMSFPENLIQNMHFLFEISKMFENYLLG